jgi:hypothetical protein
MPRAARLDAVGVVHHVIIRGIERGRIFRDDHDRENCIEGTIGDVVKYIKSFDGVTAMRYR